MFAGVFACHVRVAARHVTHLSGKTKRREEREGPLRYKVVLAGTVRHGVTWHHRNAVVAGGSSPLAVHTSESRQDQVSSRGDTGHDFAEEALCRLLAPLTFGCSRTDGHA